MFLTGYGLTHKSHDLIYLATLGIVTGVLLASNIGVPLLVKRVGDQYVEVGSGVIFLAASLSIFLFENLDGYILVAYSKKSRLKLLYLKVILAILTVAFIVLGAFFARWRFKGHNIKQDPTFSEKNEQLTQKE